jgi:tetratricopeptide (TPR) repeat protein
MKIKSFTRTLALFLIVQIASTVQSKAQALKTPAPSPLQTIDQAFGLSNMKIEYSRPSVKGRVIFGDLVPYGKVWRTGANSSTKITFGDDVKVEGVALKAGTYAIYTIPNKESWDVIFYKDLTLGGNVAEFKAADEIMRVKGKVSASPLKVETFTINIADMTTTSANIELLWDMTKVTFAVTTEIDEKVMKNIDAALEKDSRPYFQAAGYYYDNNKDLVKALGWVNTAIEQNPKAYYMVHLKAKIQLKMKDNKGAIESAEKSMAIAKEEGSEDYVHLNEKLIKEAKGVK